MKNTRLPPKRDKQREKRLTFTKLVTIQVSDAAM